MEPESHSCLVCGRDIRRVQVKSEDGHLHATIRCSDCEAVFTVCCRCGGIVRAQLARTLHGLAIHEKPIETPTADCVSSAVKAIASMGAFDIAETLARRFEVKVCAVCGDLTKDIKQTLIDDVHVAACKSCRSLIK